MSYKTVIALSLCAAFLSGCEHEQHEGHHNQKLNLEVTHPLRQDNTLVREYVSQIRAIQHIELRAMEKGYLQKTFVDEGQTVEQGQPMFQIMPTIYQAELNKAKAEAKATLIEYQNTRSLADKNVISPNELAVVKAEYEKAQAEVELAQAHLDFTHVNAPFTGKMDHLEVRTGSLLDEGELLTTLSDLSKMWVYFNVPESVYLDYAMTDKQFVDTPVKLKLANGMIYPYQGQVDTIEADFDNKTGTIEMRASFPNPDMLLRHGQTGSIQLDISYPDSLVVPQKATYEILDQTFVYVVDENNQLHQRHIKIAAELPHIFIVESGLSESDTVLIEGLRRVRDGQTISPEQIASNDVFQSLNLHAE